MEYSELIKFAKEFIKKHPGHKKNVIDLIELCNDEIEESNSSTEERENCITAIKQLIK